MKIRLLSNVVWHPDGTVTAFRNEDAIREAEHELATARREGRVATIAVVRFVSRTGGFFGSVPAVEANDAVNALLRDTR